MEKDCILRKTTLGRDEIKSRVHKIDRKLRMMLIAVNGKDTVEKMNTLFSKMPSYEGREDFFKGLKFLHDNGFVTSANERLAEISSSYGVGTWTEKKALVMKSKLKVVVSGILDKGLERVRNKINSAPDTKDGLVVAIDECEKYVRLFIDEEKAKVLASECRKVLSQAS